jgi:hypothetical protein
MPLIKLNATQGLTGTLPAVSGANLTNIDGGKVLQMITAQDNTVKSRSGEGTVDLVSLAITPSATSSKIYLIMQTAWGHSGGSNSPSATIFPVRAISGGATTLLCQEAVPSGQNNIGGLASTENKAEGIEHIQSLGGHFVDSPSTTSAITYTMRFHIADAGSHTYYMGVSGHQPNATYNHRIPHIITAFEMGA